MNIHAKTVETSAKIPSRDDLSRAALQFFFNLAEKWQLTRDQQRILLGGIPNSTYTKWKRQKIGSLSKDQLDRISYLMGIYKALNILLPTADAANSWIKKENSHALFGGQSALDLMLGGSLVDIADVRRYLDYERGA